MVKPQTKYTKSGRISLAYQVFGTGEQKIVYIPGWVSNIDLMWDSPQLVSFFQGLAEFATLILFDKRGTGLSDRVSELSTLEERMDDIRAVMDAVGIEKAALFGHSEGGSVSALFAATYPMRTQALITFGVFAKRRYSKDYPWAPTDEERQDVYDTIEQSWGSGDMKLASLAPSMASNQDFMDWLARYFRSGASPSAALVLTQLNTQVDIIDILDTIEVPTLLMQRTNDVDVKIEEGRFIHDKIKSSKLVEFEGEDHLFWVGNTKEVLNEITEFLTGVRPKEKYDRLLATILCVEIMDSESLFFTYGEEKWVQLLDKYQTLLERIIKQYRGRVVEKLEGGAMATFDGPSKAVHCGLDLKEQIEALNLPIKVVVHTGECITMRDSIGGLAIYIARRVLASASDQGLLLTQSVKNLLYGSGLETESKGALEVKGVDNPIILHQVVTNPVEDRMVSMYANNRVSASTPQNYSFLEDVLQCIENHLDDTAFGIEVLCDELGLSERQLQRKLKLITNKSPSQVIRSARLHRARDLILSDGLSVSESAYATGFNSVSYFTKCFKTEFGKPPSSIRK
ncbi:MAG: alpha/beta fold hydrolase [Saprospiraceae bacterium]